jgi:hypothetical protein
MRKMFKVKCLPTAADDTINNEENVQGTVKDIVWCKRLAVITRQMNLNNRIQFKFLSPSALELSKSPFSFSFMYIKI